MTMEALAGMIMFSGLSSDGLTELGFAYKDGKGIEDLRKAIAKGRLQDSGKVQWVARYIDAVLIAPRQAGHRCLCRRVMPWHLFEVADNKYAHNCACGRKWAWHNPTTARYAGRSS